MGRACSALEAVCQKFPDMRPFATASLVLASSRSRSTCTPCCLSHCAPDLHICRKSVSTDSHTQHNTSLNQNIFLLTLLATAVLSLREAWFSGARASETTVEPIWLGHLGQKFATLANHIQAISTPENSDKAAVDATH